jgi:hypothetical protein
VRPLVVPCSVPEPRTYELCDPTVGECKASSAGILRGVPKQAEGSWVALRGVRS